MAVTISSVAIANDTFEDWVIITNAICNSLSSVVMTANSTAGVTTGNAILVGRLQSNVFVVNTEIRGGNISDTGVLVLGSNVDFQGFNLSGNIEAVINIGADASINSTTLRAPGYVLGDVGNANATHVVTRFVVANAVQANTGTANNWTVNTGTFANLTGNNFTSNDVTSNTGTFNNLFSNNITANNFVANTGSWSNLSVENLTVNNMIVDSIAQGNSVSIGETIQLFSIFNDNITTTMSTVDSFAKATYRAVEYILMTRITGVNSHQTAKLLVIHDGDDAYLTEFGTISTNTDFTLYQVTTNATHVLLQANATATSIMRGLATRVAAT